MRQGGFALGTALGMAAGSLPLPFAGRRRRGRRRF
jgi:hypothetical protein